MKRKYIWTALIAALTISTLVWYGCTEKEEDILGSIYGTVTDYATGEPVGNVSIKLRPSGEATLTGNDGSYEFKDLSAGKYSLFLSKALYADHDDDYIIDLEKGKKVKRDIQIRKQMASLQITDMTGKPLDTLDFGSEESVKVKTFNVFNDGTESLTCTATYDCEWITNVSGLENTIQPGETKAVTVRIDRIALDDGENTTFLYITSNNGSNEIVVTATFLGAAAITTVEASNVTANSATVGGDITDDGGRPVTVRGICYGTSQTPTIDGDHTEDGSGSGSFSHNITGLSSSTTYYARAYATNRNGTYYASNIISFTTQDGLPTVTTSNVTNITATTAKGGGNVTNNGGYNVTSRGICWNTMGNPDLSDQHTTNGSGDGSFTSNMTGLSVGTTYYVRAYATNQYGTSYGPEKSFSTNGGLPLVTTATVSNITATSAACGGNITSDGGFPVTARGVCWNTVGNPDLSDSNHTTNGSGIGAYTSNITGLNPGTLYHVRAYATNSTGTVYGAEQTFTTNSGLPLVTTATVSNITANSAACGGNITSDGGFPVTARGVCWNTVGNPDLSDNNHTTNGTGIGAYTSNITGLSSGTLYHVRAYATNSTGTVYGAEQTFTTSNGAVSITLSAATNITASSATCTATISGDGGSTITGRGVCWSTSQYPTSSGSHTAVGTGTGSFTVSISSLSPSTTYYVRAYATNGTGTHYSNQISFTTNDGMPTVTTGTISNITANSAVCSGNVTSDGGFPVTAKGVCWSTTQYPTISGNHSNSGSGTGTFNSSMSGLTTGTTYYVRAYATNSTGTAYGAQLSFTTGSGLPSVSTTAPSLSGSTVATGGNVTSDGGFPVTARGVCYGNLPYPDLTSTYNHTTNGTGTGYYSSSFSLPTGSGRYYIRAYATNANGTTYGAQDSIIQPYDELPTFQYNGHTYRVAPSSTNQYYWSTANNYCDSLTYFGYSDWRLPTLAELQQMYADRNAIGDFRTQDYWSSDACMAYDYSGHKIVWFTTDSFGGSIDCITNSWNGSNHQAYYRPIRVEN